MLRCKTALSPTDKSTTRYNSVLGTMCCNSTAYNKSSLDVVKMQRRAKKKNVAFFIKEGYPLSILR